MFFSENKKYSSISIVKCFNAVLVKNFSTHKKHMKAKVILCGNSGAGKTTLMRALSNQKISMQESPTLGSGFTNYDILYKGKKINVNFWDTAGQETYRSMIRIYFRNSNLALLVIDVFNRTSIEEIDAWLQLIDQNTPNNRPSVILVGSKSDLPDPEVSEDELQKIADTYKIKWIKVSSVSGQNIDLLKQIIGEILITREDDPNYMVFRFPNETGLPANPEDPFVTFKLSNPQKPAEKKPTTEKSPPTSPQQPNKPTEKKEVVEEKKEIVQKNETTPAPEVKLDQQKQNQDDGACC